MGTIMKKYNGIYKPKEFGVHACRVTFMYDEYCGHVIYRIGGNCKGGNILSAVLSDLSCLKEDPDEANNDCQFTYREDYDVFTLVLRNGDDTMSIALEYDELLKSVVSVEIIDYKPDVGAKDTKEV